jgi:hypothetical protein
VVSSQQKRTSVSIVSFGRFVSAPAAGQIDCAREIAVRYAVAYSPGLDPYSPFVAAVKRAIDSGAHDLEVRRAVSGTRARRHDVLVGLQEPYLRMVQACRGSLDHPRRTIWSTADLDVTVTPEIVVVPKRGKPQVVKLYLRKDALTRDGADAMLQVMADSMNDLWPGADPRVWDVRREKVWAPHRKRRGFEAWLRLQASTLASLWKEFAAA